MSAEPYYKYQCEARKPGKAAHLFPVVSADAAREMCALSGWEFVRIFEPGTDSDRQAPQARGADRPLSAKQRTSLMTEAARTWKALTEHGVTDETFDDWRHAVVLDTVGKAGVSKCTNQHYARLYRKFREMRGASVTVRGGGHRGQSGERGDTMEARERTMHLIARTLGSHAARVENPQDETDMRCAAHAAGAGGVIGEAYLLTLAAAKNRAESIRDVGDLIKLPVSKLEQLHWTLVNRIAAREGRGKAKKRNKSQRKGPDA